VSFFHAGSASAEKFVFSSDDRVRAISLAMGLVPVIWTSTPEGGKFDSFGNLDLLSFGSQLIFLNADWKVASGEVTALQSNQVFEDIIKNGSKLATGYVD
jgi:hypothetical protein